MRQSHFVYPARESNPQYLDPKSSAFTVSPAGQLSLRVDNWIAAIMKPMPESNRPDRSCKAVPDRSDNGLCASLGAQYNTKSESP